MITSLKLVNFKNFASETLAIGPFTVIVGANASGKSNLRDAFRFLHGIGRGYTLAEILGGKYGPGGQVEWQPIRGKPTEISRFGQRSFGMVVKMKLNGLPTAYGFSIGTVGANSGLFKVQVESLLVEGYESIYTSHPKAGDRVLDQGDEKHLLLRMGRSESQKKLGYRIAVRPNQPALTQIGEHKHVLLDQKN